MKGLDWSMVGIPPEGEDIYIVSVLIAGQWDRPFVYTLLLSEYSTSYRISRFNNRHELYTRILP